MVFQHLSLNIYLTLYFNDAKSGICLAIEIDEPYSGNTREPIHCIEYDNEHRDDNFLGYNWIILRFAETQIANHSMQCCEVIEEIIFFLKSKENCLDYMFPNKILNFVSRWTEDEAIIMEKNLYRESYLKIKFKKFIKPQNENLPL